MVCPPSASLPRGDSGQAPPPPAIRPPRLSPPMARQLAAAAARAGSESGPRLLLHLQLSPLPLRAPTTTRLSSSCRIRCPWRPIHPRLARIWPAALRRALWSYAAAPVPDPASLGRPVAAASAGAPGGPPPPLRWPPALDSYPLAGSSPRPSAGAPVAPTPFAAPAPRFCLRSPAASLPRSLVVQATTAVSPSVAGGAGLRAAAVSLLC